VTAHRLLGCEHDFVGRESELERVITAAHAKGSLTILAAPAVGATELLRHAYDELFLSESVIPFYFELRRSDRDAASAAKRFAYEFLVQALAYARRDPELIAIQPPSDEISRLAPAEFSWIDAAVEMLVSESNVATCVGIVARPRRHVAMLIDGLDRARLIRDGGSFMDAIRSLRGVSVIASGLRRALYGRLPFEQMALEPLAFVDCAKATASIAEHRGIATIDATRDLMTVQTEGSITTIDLLLAQAADDGDALIDFAAVERAYTDSIFGGRISRHLRNKILRPLPHAADQNAIIRILAETLATESKRLPMRNWRRALHDVDDAAFGRLIRHLHIEEAISAGDGTVNMSATSRVIRDYVASRAQILESPDKRAVIVGRALVHNVNRAPRLMTEFYRSSAAVGVRGLLEMFNDQAIVRAAIDYGPFKRQLKGQDDEAVIDALRTSTDTIDLPRIVYTADAATFYPPLRELSDRDRSAVGLSESGDAWFTAEIDSKLEADTATAEFWCDRLEMAAVNAGFENYRIWLIAPEGFTDEALDILTARNAYGSSRRQVELLRQLLSTRADDEAVAATNYEITVEMGENGELMAARTFSEIADKHSIPNKAATQIKTALIEAMINAAEHSLSPDRRVDIAFAVTTNMITITVTNRGLRLTNHMLSQTDAPSERRGWGLKLIRQLMDDVRVEPTDDGTRLVMVKHFASS
jgi:anti-sigma regulatory factor (Ser/Thr protein kinase)